MNNFETQHTMEYEKGYVDFDLVITDKTEIIRIKEKGKMNKIEQARNLPGQRIQEIENLKEMQLYALEDITN